MGKFKIDLAVAAVIENPYGSAVLLARRAVTGQYSLVGGSVEVGEGLMDAVGREIREECGLMEVAIRRIFRVIVEVSPEGLWIGVVFLGIFLPGPNDNPHQKVTNYDDRTMDLTDGDAAALRFYGRRFVGRLVERHPEQVFMAQRNLPTLRLWLSDYSPPLLADDIWWEAFVEPVIGTK